MSIPDPKDELITHLPALRAFALSLTRNRATADDMLQDTVLRLRTHNQNMTVAASAIADRNTLGHLS